MVTKFVNCNCSCTQNCLKGSLERTWKQGMWELKDQNSSGRILLRKSSSASSFNHLQVRDVHRQHSDTDLASYKEESDTDTEKTTSDQSDSTTTSNTSNEVMLCDSVKKDKERKTSKCWPKDWLPLDCPGVRVIALNYTTDPYLWRPVWINKRCR